MDAKVDNALSSHHLVINEIFVNPSNGSLPEFEWIELYNPTSQNLNLSEYSFVYNSRYFPLTEMYLSAGQYIILTSASARSELESYGNVMVIDNFPTLNNTEGVMQLSHSEDGVVDDLSYSNRWYSTPQKRNGGWSLERISPSVNCNAAFNWSESMSIRGATPGVKNSVADFSYVPELPISTSVITEDGIAILFDRELEEGVMIESVVSDDVVVSGWELSEDSLKILTETTVLPGKSYQFKILANFCSQMTEGVYTHFNNHRIEFNDVVINEILFNPKEGGVDFVEIYNNSEKVIDLNGWKLGARLIANRRILMEPKSYYFITTNPDLVKFHYPSTDAERVIQAVSLPGYANLQGEVTLFSLDGMIDSVRYEQGQHQSFLISYKGISLERISPDISSSQAENFTSSATWGEGATPGYQNSQSGQKNYNRNTFFLKEKIFIIPQDNVHKYPLLGYELSGQNTMVTLTILDEKGREVNRLIRNQSLGLGGIIAWDGRDESGKTLSSGTYYFYANIYNESGLNEVFKAVFILVRH